MGPRQKHEPTRSFDHEKGEPETMSVDETADLDELRLVCPITAQLFEDPVFLVEDGYTYERSAVTAWLEKHDTSPMSGAPLATKTLAPNIRARQQADAAREGKPPPEAKRDNEVTRLGKASERLDAAAGPGPASGAVSAPARSDSELLRWVRTYAVPNGGPRAAQRPVYDWFDAQDGWHVWPLHRAAMRGECARVRELTVETGRFDANQKMTDWFDSEPLGWAASFGELDAVRALIECGADPLRPPNAAGQTPLTDAEREGHAHVVRFLKEFAYRSARPHVRSDQDVDVAEIFNGRHDGPGDPMESNFGFVLCPVFGHPDYDKGAYHAPVGCCCVRQNRAEGGATHAEAFFESLAAAFFLPFIVPLYVATCFYKPLVGLCWWGDAPCTEHRVTPQYARVWPCCLTRGAAADRRRRFLVPDADPVSERPRTRETLANGAAPAVAAPPRARMLRAAPRGATVQAHHDPKTRKKALPSI